MSEAFDPDTTAAGFLPRRDGMLFQAVREQAVDELDDNELLARLEPSRRWRANSPPSGWPLGSVRGAVAGRLGRPGS
jgi:hypothetical protein